MVLAEDGETDELEEFVILCLPSLLIVPHRPRHHAADRQHIAEILLDLADRCLEGRKGAVGIGF